MTTESTSTRRTVIKSAIAGLSLGAASGAVRGRPDRGRSGGRGRGRTPLIDGAAEFQMFVGESGDGSEDPDEATEFDFPTEPTSPTEPRSPGNLSFAGEDPAGGGLFDAGIIEKTPNGNTLHHVFEFFQGLLIRSDRGKPYVLRHEGDGRFTSRGQHVNFEAVTAQELQARLVAVGQNPALAGVEPLATLAGGTWRGVGADVVQFLGDPAESRRLRWSVTRVDFYRRGGGRPTHELSALYVIYPNVDGDGNPEPANPASPTIRGIPPETRDAALELIEAGRRNPGGQ